MADPRSPTAGRYAFAGALKNSRGVERWLAVDVETGRRVVLAVADAARLVVLDSARGVKHRHLAGVIAVLREVDSASLPSGNALPSGFGVAIAEFVPGRTLHAELLHSGMNSAKAVAWSLRLADAVQTLHTAGADHGALSPRSVIAVPEGRAIAPVLSQLVVPGMGPFCPPERLKGSGETAADDVWALHATLYSMLTQQAPFNAVSRDALLKQMLSGRPKPLAAFGIDEPALQEILDRGLAYEKRVRVCEAAEFIQALDGWERDPRAMPAKRHVPPRPSPRSLMDIVGATGLAKDRDDGIVIDGSALPDDEGSELNPKPLSQTQAVAVQPSSPVAAALPVYASIPLAPPRAAMASGPTLSGVPSGLPSSTVAPAPNRVSINPFERKRSVWPLVLVAAVVGGGGVYVAVAPDAPPSRPGVEAAVAPVVTQKAAQPARPRLNAAQARDACVTSYFDPGAFDKERNFAFVCGDGDFREVATLLQQTARVIPAGADAGAPGAGDAGLSSSVRGSGLDWYELPATAIIRRSCCDGAVPITLPETAGWCEQLQTAVRRIADDSGKAGDLAPDARSFDKAVACLFANRVPHSYPYERPPSEANRRAFQQFLSRAAISEARR
ncbi:MAG: hypothetical protein ABJB12_18680 [Pseudomonadota bacterium]